MGVAEALKYAAGHFVHEEVGPIVIRYFGGELLPDAEVTGFEGDFDARFEQAVPGAGDDAFASFPGGEGVEAHVASGIEAD